jgi:hypothetical protein
MKVSMNGFRRSLAAGYSKTVMGYRELTDGTSDVRFAEEELKEGLDELRQMIGILFCIYSEDDPEFTNMADEADLLPFADPEDAEGL